MEFKDRMMLESSSKFREKLRDHCIKKLDVRNHYEVLDAGTGRSLFPVGLAEKVCSAYGIDIWLNRDLLNSSLKNAKKDMKNEGVEVDFTYGNIREIPFEDDSFNSVISG